MRLETENEMKNLIEVNKVELRDGEELQQFIGGVIKALGQHRQKTNKSLALRGIFKGFVIAQDMENGKFFRMQVSRDDAGLFAVGKGEEVRQAFVPVRQKAEKAETQEPTLVAVNGEVSEVQVESEHVLKMIETIAAAAEDAPKVVEIVEQKPSVWTNLELT
jgi:hypothetical protein